MSFLKNKKILFIGMVWPEPTSSAAGYRIMQLVKLFISYKTEVHFASAATKTERSTSFPPEVILHQIALNDSNFDEFISQLKPDIVLFDRFLSEEQYGWRVYQQCPNALTILDTEDLHFVRKAREQAYKKQSEPNYYSDIAKREIASILKTDIALIISQEEIKILKNFHADKNAIYLPFTVTEKEILDKLPYFSARKDFMFIGNFHHEPNYQTVIQLKKKYWTPIKKLLPNTKLYIYGAYPTQKIWDLHNEREGFIVKGAVDNVDEVMQKHRLLLAPIPFGAGIKGKFFDAAKNRLAWISSTMGSEGMNFPAAYISDDIENFTLKAVELYTTEDSWNKATNWATNWFKQQYVNSEYELFFQKYLINAIENLEIYRNKNFLGQILKQQQFQATKYMSLWIEEKNKKE